MDVSVKVAGNFLAAAEQISGNGFKAVLWPKHVSNNF